MLDDVLSGVREVDLTLPCHHAEDVEAKQDTRWMEFGVGFLEEAGDHVGALDRRWELRGLRASGILAWQAFEAAGAGSCRLQIARGDCRTVPPTADAVVRMTSCFPRWMVDATVLLIVAHFQESGATSGWSLWKTNWASFWSPSAGKRT